MRFWLQRRAPELGQFGAGAEGRALEWRQPKPRRRCGKIVAPGPGAGR